MVRHRWDPKTDTYHPVKGEAVLHFREFESAQPTRADAEACGAHFSEKDGVSTFRTERSLREYLARERRAGRDTRWREH